jgi:hypothetical protein
VLVLGLLLVLLVGVSTLRLVPEQGAEQE